MTIGIGVLASESSILVTPNHLVLMADTMGSFGDAYSHPRLHKIFTYPELRMYATCSGLVDKAAEVMSVITDGISKVAAETRDYGHILNVIATACFHYRQEKFRIEILPKYRLPPDEAVPRSTLPNDLQEKLQMEWKSFHIGCDLILGTFDNRGQALLFRIDGEGSVVNFTFPGFCAIGIDDYAMFWLSHRRHDLGMSLRRAAFHAYEAKSIAEDSAHVNDEVDFLIANKDKSWFCSSHRPDLGQDSPVSLDQLKQLLRQYGPRGTDRLDPARPTSQKRSKK